MKRLGNVFLAFVFHLGLSFNVQAELVWKNVSDGVLYSLWTIDNATTAHVFSVDLKKYFPKIIQNPDADLKNLSQMVQEKNNFLAINGSFFDKDLKTMGVVVSEGSVLRKYVLKRWPFVAFTNKNTVQFGYGSSFSFSGVVTALQGLPFLIFENQVIKLQDKTSQRTVLCKASQSFYVLQTSVISLQILAQKLHESPFFCSDAINLDGGPSSQLYAKFDNFVIKNTGFAGIANALLFVKK